VGDIDTAAVDSLKTLDPKRPIREATEQRTQFYVGFVPKADVNLNITSARLWLPNTPISPATPQPARTWRRSLSAAQPKQWYP
jgi:hypothetical protein